MPARRVTMEERLVHQTVHSGECLIWTGSDRKGYPDTCVLGRHVSVHRWVLERKLGRPLASTEQACHSCDTPMCVRENHLFAGTVQVNRDDCVDKGRQARGARTNTAKMDDSRSSEIRRRGLAGESPTALAAEFGLCRSTIKRTINGKYWRHL